MLPRAAVSRVTTGKPTPWLTVDRSANSLLAMRTTRALNAGAFALSGSFMVVFPLLPALQERAGISTSQLGWIATAGFVAALVAQLVVVPHADRGRERLVISAAIVTMALSTLMYVFGNSIGWFVAGRIGAGLAYGAFIPTAVGLIVRHCPDRDRKSTRLNSSHS